MELQECRMTMVLWKEEMYMAPEIVAIVIVPTLNKALGYATEEVKRYLCAMPPTKFLVEVKDLGAILFPPAPTTVFLYTKKGGRIK